MNAKHLIKQVYAAYVLSWTAITSRYPVGTNVFNEEWDVLVLLDACRVDALQAVSSEYEFIEAVNDTWSIGSTSKEWIERTFIEENIEQIEKTAYITANPYSRDLLGERGRLEYIATVDTWVHSSPLVERIIDDNVINPDDIGHIEALWGSAEPETGFHASQKPDSITKHAIKAARSGNYDRVIAHYMQPHHPYFSTSTELDELSYIEKNPFEALKNGDQNEVWAAYLDNLRYALDWVEKLIQNVDGKVVITSDHGELMGEQGMYFHTVGNLHPKLRKVPWIELNTTDTSSIQPEVSLSGLTEGQEVTKAQLEALGYM